MSKNNKNLDDNQIFEAGAILLKRMIDGEPKNINPLVEIPKPQMKLYGLHGVFKSDFFDTKKELKKHVKKHKTQIGNICIIEYLGFVAGKSDVIRLTFENGKQILYTSVNRDGYAVYNNERSIYRGEFVWEFHYGSINEIYSAFRDRGIVFENDIYSRIEERDRKLFEKIEENRKKRILSKEKNI